MSPRQWASAAVVISLALTGCVSIPLTASSPTTGPPEPSTASSVTAPSSSQDPGDDVPLQTIPPSAIDLTLLRKEIREVPILIEGPWATVDNRAYRNANIDRASESPFGPEDGEVVTEEFSYVVPPSVAALVSTARLVVGTVEEIGVPHFNSSDGSWWDPALLVGQPPYAVEIFRDVRIDVEEVLGDALGVGVSPGDPLVFSMRGGAVLVRFGRSQPDATLPDGHPTPSGDVVFESEPPVDLAVGDRGVFFLNWVKLGGLFDGRVGDVFELFPANEKAFLAEIDGDDLVNRGVPSLRTTRLELEELVSLHLGEVAGPLPVPGVLRPGSG